MRNHLISHSQRTIENDEPHFTVWQYIGFSLVTLAMISLYLFVSTLQFRGYL